MRSDQAMGTLRFDQGLRLPQWSSSFRFASKQSNSAGHEGPLDNCQPPGVPGHLATRAAEGATQGASPRGEIARGSMNRCAEAAAWAVPRSQVATVAGGASRVPCAKGHPVRAEPSRRPFQSPLPQAPVAAVNTPMSSVRRTPLPFRKTPGSTTWRAAVGDSLGRPLNAGTLRELPNATQAEFWINKASVQEERGDAAEAEAVLREGLRRKAEPQSLLAAALEALLHKRHSRAAVAQPSPQDTARELSFEFEGEQDSEAEAEQGTGSPFMFAQENLSPEVLGYSEAAGSVEKNTPASTPSAACDTPCMRRQRNLGTPGRIKTPGVPPTRGRRELRALAQGTELLQPAGPSDHGTISLLTPVRATAVQTEELGSAMVLTQVRRSARKTPAHCPLPEVESMLEQCNFSYVPNLFAQETSPLPSSLPDPAGTLAEGGAQADKADAEAKQNEVLNRDEGSLSGVAEAPGKGCAGEDWSGEAELTPPAPATSALAPGPGPRTRSSAHKASATAPAATDTTAATDLAQRLKGVSLEAQQNDQLEVTVPTPLRRSSRLRKQQEQA